jgi:hypothetical protein
MAMKDLKKSTTNRIARLIHTSGNRQVWEVHYAWLNGTGLMVIEGHNIISIENK